MVAPIMRSGNSGGSSSGRSFGAYAGNIYRSSINSVGAKYRQSRYSTGVNAAALGGSMALGGGNGDAGGTDGRGTASNAFV